MDEAEAARQARPGGKTFAAAMTVAILVLVASIWLFIQKGDATVLFLGAIGAGIMVLVAWIRFDAATLGIEARPWMTLVVVVPILLVSPLFSGDGFLLSYVASVALLVLVVLGYLLAREIRLAGQK